MTARSGSRRTAGLLVIACVFAGDALASAPPASGKARLAAHQIHLALRADGAPWPEHVVEELARGLEHLPPELRTAPGGPLELHYSDRTMPFGMGDGSKETPVWSARRRRFHLYAWARSEERRAEYRLDRLSERDQESLWRRRALVHAIVQRWDEDKKWSQASTWRRLNGWILPFERLLQLSEDAINDAEWAYSRALGRRSARLDLVTFAEEALVPVEAIDPGALEQADQVRCQEFSKSRYLREVGLLTAPRGPCERFDQWADLPTLGGFEFLFVAASGRAPESLFGHLLLRIERRSESHVIGPGLTPAVQLVALTGGDLPGPAYVVRGLFGGYPLVLMTVPMLDVIRQMLEYEQRTMRRHRLRLTASESERLFERIWELERRGRLDYRFLHDNCAFAAAFLVNGALEEGREIRLPSRVTPLLPAATLDSVAKVDSGLGGRLLEPVPGALASTRDRARTSHEARLAAYARLHGLLGERTRAAFEAVHAQAEDADPALRLEAYGHLEAVLGTGPLAEAQQEALFSYLAHSVALERYVFDEAEALAIKTQIAALKVPPTNDTGDDEAATRERQFEREADLEGAMAVLDRPQKAQARLEQLPKRELTAAEQEVLDAADAAAGRLDSLLLLQTRLLERSAPDVDPVRWFREDRARVARSEAEQHARSLRPSGYGRFEAAAGVTREGGALQPVVTVRSAAFSEELGDHRLHGLDPASELTTLTGEVELLRGDQWLPRVRRSEFLAAAYRNVRREPAPFRDEVWDDFGWGFRGGYSFDARRTFSQRAFVSGEGLAVLDDTPDYTRITTFGLGAHAAFGLEGLRPELIAGPRVTLWHRRALGHATANALRFAVDYSPGYRLLTARWEHALTGQASLEWPLKLGRWPLLLSATGRVDLRVEPGRAFEWIPTASIGIEPLAF